MGRIKEFCIDLINANGGIPEGITIADVARMKELEIYNWEEYERQQEKIRSQFIESENPGEIAKVKQVQKKFSNYYGEAREEKRSEQ
jgi:hypothetical protein